MERLLRIEDLFNDILSYLLMFLSTGSPCDAGTARACHQLQFAHVIGGSRARLIRVRLRTFKCQRG